METERKPPFEHRMATFEIRIPNHEAPLGPGDLRVEASHWIEAWSRAMERLGLGPADPGRMDCTFEDDGSIEITDRENGNRMLLRAVNVFRGREITLESLTDLCAAPARPANAFAITRNMENVPNQELSETEDEVAPLPTQMLQPALSWYSHDIQKIETAEEAIAAVMESFPCELAVHLVPTEERSWRVNVCAGAEAKRVRGSLLSGTTPIPPWKGALVGRRAFGDESRRLLFERRLRFNVAWPVRSAIWTTIPAPKGGLASRLMLVNGAAAHGFGDQDLSGLVSLVQALGAKWGQSL